MLIFLDKTLQCYALNFHIIKRWYYMYYLYKIENSVNHKKYIGLTNNVKRRRSRHFTDLLNNNHDNAFFQKEYNIFGKESFTFEVILEGDYSHKEISVAEVKAIEEYDSYFNGYNQNKGGNFGPSNGGSQLTESDIFCILSALEFMSRPGQVLADIFEISRTTVSRIKREVSHNEIIEKYKKLSIEEKKRVYEIFCESHNLLEKKANSTIIESKRKLNEEQVHIVLFNEVNGRIIPLKRLAFLLGLKSGNTLTTILNKKSYQDYSLSYLKLDESQKDKLASLLSNMQ